MVSSVNSTNTNNTIGTLLNNQTKLSAVLNDNELWKNLTDTINLGCFDSKADMLSYCSGGIGTLEDFSNALDSVKGLDTSNIDYEAEYQDYMEYRGCSNQSQLDALNTTTYRTADDMYGYAKVNLEDCAYKLSQCGVNVSQDDVSSILSGTSFENVAKYVSQHESKYNSETANVSFEDSVSCFQSFLSNVSDQENASSDLKSLISSLYNNISTSSSSITAYSDLLKEEAAADSSNTNQAKYNATLIANYSD